jgi:hypothetical protein
MTKRIDPFEERELEGIGQLRGSTTVVLSADCARRCGLPAEGHLTESQQKELEKVIARVRKEARAVGLPTIEIYVKDPSENYKDPVRSAKPVVVVDCERNEAVLVGETVVLPPIVADL